MTVNLIDLEGKSKEELRGICKDLGLPFGFNSGKDLLISRILIALEGTEEVGEAVEPETVAEPVPEAVEPDPVLEDIRETPRYTPEQAAIVSALKSYMANGLTIKFPPPGDHWVIRAGLKTDSGRLDLPIKVIQLCAGKVCKPAKTTSVY